MPPVETNPVETAAATPPTAPVVSPPRLSDPERWVEEHGDYLFKFALVRLRDPAKAEDMVQETFLAALKGGQSFAGRSAEKSWLAGILKHKILDHYRNRQLKFLRRAAPRIHGDLDLLLARGLSTEARQRLVPRLREANHD